MRARRDVARPEAKAAASRRASARYAPSARGVDRAIAPRAVRARDIRASFSTSDERARGSATVTQHHPDTASASAAARSATRAPASDGIFANTLIASFAGLASPSRRERSMRNEARMRRAAACAASVMGSRLTTARAAASAEAESPAALCVKADLSAAWSSCASDCVASRSRTMPLRRSRTMLSSSRDSVEDGSSIVARATNRSAPAEPSASPTTVDAFKAHAAAARASED
mmetsp:Transcript_6983/g.28146  ORF Transcript_6983/g.28146 Transcript_6983/m.28146 type:complete len:231 (-) Transcript_6983:3925-4617(-)